MDNKIYRELRKIDIRHMTSNVILDDDYLLFIEARLNIKCRPLEIFADVYLKSGYSTEELSHHVIKDGTSWAIVSDGEDSFKINGTAAGIPVVFASYEDMVCASELVICWHIYSLDSDGNLLYQTLRSHHHINFDKKNRQNYVYIEESFADDYGSSLLKYETVIGANGDICARNMRHKWSLNIENRKIYKAKDDSDISETERLFYAEVLNSWPKMALAEHLMVKNSANILKWEAQIFVQTIDAMRLVYKRGL